MTTNAAEAFDAATEGKTPEAYDLTAPVPVVVTEAVRVLDYPPRTITTDQVPVALLPVRVVNELRTRARVRLTARGAACYISGDAGVTAGTGYLLAVDESITLDASAAVFAVATTGGAFLHILTEHRDG